MIKTSNLADQIQKQLPVELVSFTRLAGDTASEMGQKLYLVGGVVRDLLLERTNFDLDLVAEGDAIKLAQELARLKKGRVIAHSRFNTAKIKWNKWSVDIACSRSEGYEKPGALPIVQPCDIRTDLSRRDFTINALAVKLDPAEYGELIDLYKGLTDLEKRYIRVLHDSSFKDDATRIWRAARYEQRLDFRIEPHTLSLLERDIGYLETVSGDRIRHELELCLEEERPEKVLLRADELGILARICLSLKADEWVAKRISRARGRMEPYSPPRELYLAFLIYRLTPETLRQLISCLNLPRATSRILEETLDLKHELPGLDAPGIKPGRIYRSLHGYSQNAVLANLLASDSHLIREHIELYLNHLRYVKPLLSGTDLKEMDIASGPDIKEALDALREARLDGLVTNRDQELEFLKARIQS
jgi:tRNA nucleotidyltransferase (CCA-adding enzyme)